MQFNGLGIQYQILAGPAFILVFIFSAVSLALFSASARGVANGVFSWGVYYGYGLAFVFGIYITGADLAGYGWRAPFVLAALPGLLLAILLITTFPDPRQAGRASKEQG